MVNGQAATPIRAGGALYVASSFGVDATTFGPGFNANAFVNSDRVRELEFKERFFRCTQHDWKTFDFNGRLIPPGGLATQPLISAQSSAHYVPLEVRRPSNPYRLARVIVNAFTSLVFGYQQWPKIGDNDHETEDFANALAKAANLHTVMIRARNMGGSLGTVGLSWRFVDGKPRVVPHSGKHLFVHSWEDRDELIPEHVSEIYQYPRDEFDPSKGEIVRRWYWFRRDWTPLADVSFVDTPVGKENPTWLVDEERTFVHGDGFAHFVWIQNLPEDDGTTTDGQPDYAELYENFNALDVLASVVHRGAAVNLDPTLILKMDPHMVDKFGVKKGSDNALAVGKDGDASYMELAGSSLELGIKLFESERDSALEVAQCVIPDPNEIAAAGTSAVALRLVFAPMLGKGSVLRTQYGKAIERILEQMVAHAKSRYEAADVEVEVEVDETGQAYEVETPVEYRLALPPRVVVTGRDSEGNEITELVERMPGTGGDLSVDWGDFFEPTVADRQVTTQSMSVAVGGKPVLSQRAAVEVVAKAYQLDPKTVYDEVLLDAKAAIAAQAEADAAMYPAPGGATGPGTDESKATQRVVNLRDTDAIVTVNEGRVSVGLSPLLYPDGTPDPDGNLSIEEYRAKRRAKGEAAGEAEADDDENDDTTPRPVPPQLRRRMPPRG